MTAMNLNRAIRGPVTAVPVVAGKGVRIVPDTVNNRFVVEADETVLWENNNPQYTSDNKGVVSATLPETIANFESVEFWVATNGNSQNTTRVPQDMVFKCTVTNSKAGFLYVIPENSTTGNWFKWYGTIDGVTLSATGGYSAANNAGNTTITGGLWSRGSLYKVVGINRISGGN